MYNILQIHLISFLPKYMKRISYMPLSSAKQVLKGYFPVENKINMMDARNRISIYLHVACSVLRKFQETNGRFTKTLALTLRELNK